MNCFGGIIYALRKSRYLTQEQLAEQLLVSSVIREAQRLVLELVKQH